MATDALYYPWIDPPSSTLLKTSMLYWDHLYTIVPATIAQPYERPATTTAQKLGFLRSRVVDSNCPEVGQASSEFEQDIERTAITRDVEDVNRRAQSQKGGTRIHPAKLSASLHPEKVSWKLRERLWQTEMPDQNGFYRIADGYAAPYMARLASVIAEADGTAPYTDRRLSHNIVVDRHAAEYDAEVDRNEARLAALSLSTIRLSSRASLMDVYRFREDHHDELVAYRSAIRKFSRKAATVRDPADLERELRRILEDELTPAQEEVEGKLRDASHDFSLAAFEVASVAMLGYAASGFREPLAALGGAAIGLTFSAVRWRREQERNRAEPLSYLVSLRKRFEEK